MDLGGTWPDPRMIAALGCPPCCISHSVISPYGLAEEGHRPFHQPAPDRSTGCMREASTTPLGPAGQFPHPSVAHHDRRRSTCDL
jgi:hypothetical protein